MSILEEIVQHKRIEIEALRETYSVDALRKKMVSASTPRGFLPALQNKAEIAVIAELKKKSPSKGVLCKEFKPAQIAKRYAECGAAAFSILTDERYFDGRLAYLSEVRAVSVQPILRKDFILDEVQVYQSRLGQADAILLIAAILTDQELSKLNVLAHSLGLDTLVELHTKQEAERVVMLKLDPAHTALGINNRDLHTFKVDLKQSERIRPLIPEAYVVVSESGIRDSNDLIYLKQQGIQAALVGESLITQPDPGQALKELLK